MDINGLGDRLPAAAAARKAGAGFAAIMKDKLDAADTDAADSASVEALRNDIAGKIAGMPVHPTQAKTNYFTQISDQAMRLMRDDPEFGKEALDAIARERETAYVSPAPAYVRLYLDENGRLSRLVEGEETLVERDAESEEYWEQEPVVLEPLAARGRQERAQSERREAEEEVREQREERDLREAAVEKKRETRRTEWLYLERHADGMSE